MAGSEDQTLEQKAAKAKTRFFRVWGTIGVLVLLVAVLYVLSLMPTVVSVLIWTLLIVVCLRPLVNWLDRKGVRRGLGTTIAYIVMVGALYLFNWMMFSPNVGFGQQIADFVSNVPAYVNRVTAWAQEVYSQYVSFADENQTIANWIQTASSSLASWASNFATLSAQGVVNIGSALLNSIVVIGFAVVIAFWILMQLPQLGAETRRLVNPKYTEDLNFLHLTMTRVAGGYIKATLLQSLIIGVGSGIVCWIMGMQNPAAWGLIVGVMNIIPVIGPWIGGILAGIVALFISPLTALIVFAGIVVVERLVMTFVSPLIIGSTIEIHPVLTMIVLCMGSAIGYQIAGLGGSILGMLLCVPLVAAAKALFVYYFEKRTGRQIVDKNGFFFKGEPSDKSNLDPVADASTGVIQPVPEITLPMHLNFGQPRESAGHEAAPQDDAAQSADSSARSSDMISMQDVISAVQHADDGSTGAHEEQNDGITGADSNRPAPGE